MPAENTLPAEKVVKDFLECETHAERCAFFHQHPELKTVFREVHFPKANETPASGVAQSGVAADALPPQSK